MSEDEKKLTCAVCGQLVGVSEVPRYQDVGGRQVLAGWQVGVSIHFTPKAIADQKKSRQNPHGTPEERRQVVVDGKLCPGGNSGPLAWRPNTDLPPRIQEQVSMPTDLRPKPMRIKIVGRSQAGRK